MKKEKLLLAFVAILWVILSLRIYPSSFEKTILESIKILFGTGLYALGLTIIINGLKFRFTKKSFSRAQFLRWALLIALLTSLSASFEHYFRMK
ncbi:MAG: hypothetical protein RMI63_00580 [Caldimicrobium sp.]|nr:hypothetical protein [Caldimicrobium sp.]